MHKIRPLALFVAALGLVATLATGPASAGVQCFGQEATVYDDSTEEGHETFYGTANPDVIVITGWISHDVRGLGSGDRICDRSLNLPGSGIGQGSWLYGGGGGDRLAGFRAVAFYGQNGADLINGTAGSDTIDGGRGNDDLYGKGGSGDYIYGRDGNDYLNGGSDGALLLSGGPGTDTCVNAGVGGSKAGCEN